MTTGAIKNSFVHTVVSGFVEKAKGSGDLSSITWMQDHLFNPQSTQQDVDNFAQGLLDDFRSSVPKNDSKRYQFRTLKASDELLKLIFEEGFHHDPRSVVMEAQRAEGSFSGSFYPLWKRVCLIDIPKILGAFLGNTLVKIAISVAAVYCSYQLGHIAFEKTVHFFTARGIPFLINNTPMAIVQSTNQILSTVDWVRRRKWEFLLYGFVIQQGILLGPTIPYFTAAVRSVSIWNIGLALYRSPHTLFGFLVEKGLYGALFVWHTSGFFSAFFNSVAIKAESDCLAISKSKSYTVWKSVIAKNTPVYT